MLVWPRNPHRYKKRFLTPEQSTSGHHLACFQPSLRAPNSETALAGEGGPGIPLGLPGPHPTQSLNFSLQTFALQSAPPGGFPGPHIYW